MTKNRKHKCPSYPELFFDVLKTMEDLGGSASIGEIHTKVIERRRFNDDVVDEMHPGSMVMTELEYQLAWARTYLKKSGLITRSKNGVWALTKEGAAVCKRGSIDRKEVVKTASKAYADSSADTKQDSNLLEIEEKKHWKEQLSDILHKMNPYSFEKLAQRLLRECGFADVVVTRKSGDGGIDGTGKLLMNGIFSFNVAFQCKRYSGQVGSAEVRNFRGSLDNNIEKGVLITTGSFSKAAQEEASAPGKKQIDLMDGNGFMDKLAEYGIGLTPKVDYEIDEKFYASFDSEDDD